jgi:membrane-anchored protein YejM (alkaline phosphatase superfamily)
MSNFSGEENFVLATLDSCRWDVFSSACMPNIKSLGIFRKAFSQGTFTYPSHLSMFSGHLPQAFDDLPYYNRFNKYLFFIRGGTAKVASYLEFPIGTPDIIQGFRRLHYKTFGFGAVEWFKHPNLSTPFDTFIQTGIHLERQLGLFLDYSQSANQAPFFGFINIGETHDPFEFGGLIRPQYRYSTRMRASPSPSGLTELYDKQVSACEFIDAAFGPFVEALAKGNRKTILIICGDHGECFGEDGLYGHGFYHPKIMEVPLGIFEI